MRNQHLILFLSFFLFSATSTAQNAFYDAEKAKKIKHSLSAAGAIQFEVDSSNMHDFNEVFKYYLPDSAKIPNSDFELYKAIKAALEGNVFIEMAGTAQSDDDLEKKVAGLIPGALNKSIGFVGSLNVTNIADALARFLIKRGKEELNVAFFNRMRDFLERNEECKTLFPSTTEFLKNIDVARSHQEFPGHKRQ